MKNLRKFLIAGGSILVGTAVAHSSLAQASASTSATASVTIFQPITVAKNSDLQFGRVIRPSTGNTTTYTIGETNGTPSVAGGDGIFSGNTTPTRALFTANGEGGQAFNITSDPSVVNGGVTITLVKSAANATMGGTLGSSGSATFGVGGNVVLTSASPTGLKTGSFNVTVAYQ